MKYLLSLFILFTFAGNATLAQCAKSWDFKIDNKGCFSRDPISGTLIGHHIMVFTDKPVYPSDSATISWNFDDGWGWVTGRDSMASSIYNKPGWYNIKMLITNSKGDTCTYTSHKVHLDSLGKPELTVSSAFITKKAYKVMLNDITKGSIRIRKWIVAGTGGNSFSHSMTDSSGSSMDTLTLSKPGYYDVLLQVIDSYACTRYSIIHKAIYIPAFRDSLKGIITQSNGSALANSKVYLCTYKPSDSTINPIDSTLTDSSGHYSFIVTDSIVYLLAIPNRSSYPGEMPVWYDTSLTFNMNSTIRLDSTTSVKTVSFSTRSGSYSGGSGFIGGKINVCNLCKKAGPGQPVSNLRVILINESGKPVTYTYTDSKGHFLFNNLAGAKYKIIVDQPGVDNSRAPQVDISSGTGKDNLTFTLYPGYLSLSVTSGIENTVADEPVFSIYPNPAGSTIHCLFSLNRETAISISLYSMDGRMLQNIPELRLSAGIHDYSLETDRLKIVPGMYILKATVGENSFVREVVIE